MRADLDEYLVKEYAPLYRQRHASMKQTAMCWGFEHGDGWFKIIDNLSFLLCRDWISARQTYDRLRAQEGTAPYSGAEIVSAVDVERARLAMTAAAESVPIASQVKEKFGSLRFYIDSGTDVHYALISFAEAMSSETCETCGKPGARTQGGWIKCLCDECRTAQGLPVIGEEEAF